MKRIIFTVTNDLNYDQRMHRIAGALDAAGYEVLLVGRKMKTSIPLLEKKIHQKRLNCLFHKGPLFYVEYNFRLLFFLLSQKADVIVAIDLDTILPCYFSSLLKKQQRVYDAHELFIEQFEVIRRPAIRKIWQWIEAFAVPKFRNGYTVNDFIAKYFQEKYGVNYEVIRNLPAYYELAPVTQEGYILYQGAVNEGRSFETLIPAMQYVNAKLVICGHGNFFEATKELIRQYQLTDKIDMKGYIEPEALKIITQKAAIGLTLFHQQGLNQYQSLSNRFFDYMMAGIPQLCVNYPEYANIHQHLPFAYLIDSPDSNSIAQALNKMLADHVLYTELQQNALKARSLLNWEHEAPKLIRFYNRM